MKLRAQDREPEGRRGGSGRPGQPEGGPRADTEGGGEARPYAGTDVAIRTRDLTKDFPAVRALDRLTLEVPRGSVFGFLGPNGAGKTTAIRLLLGLLRPTAGTAEVLGMDPATEGAGVRARCGVLLEHSGLIERLSARDNLEFHGRIWRLPRARRRARIRELLTNLGLWERREDRVGHWSRGMRQKLAIARALLHGPELVFLDEPTAGLDPVAAAALRQDLARLARQEGVTVFLSTHNLSEAERLCDAVGVIREGSLLAAGSPGDLRRVGKRPRVRVAGRGFTDNVLEHLRGRAEVADVRRENGHLLLGLCGPVEVAPLVSFLVRVGAQVEEVRRIDDSLEQTVLELIEGRRTAPRDSWLRRTAGARGGSGVSGSRRGVGT